MENAIDCAISMATQSFDHGSNGTTMTQDVGPELAVRL
jgi:hypothetical protein